MDKNIYLFILSFSCQRKGLYHMLSSRYTNVLFFEWFEIDATGMAIKSGGSYWHVQFRFYAFLLGC
jgi:hypothetical protein